MSDYVPLPHKYRPRTWTDLVGQEVATATLKRALENGRIFPAYIFAGAAGCGKTTAARILGMALNCEALENGSDPCLKCTPCTEALKGRNVDIVEIDGPSHGSVAHIRDLKEKAVYSPQGSKKVFIIDEAHGLSRDAFEAFLKLLEEPPGHVVFILATTNPEKIPATIQSRAIMLDFKRHTEDNVVARLRHIVAEEGLIVHGEALELIAKACDGNLRNSITELDKLVTIHPGTMIDESLVTTTLGIISGTEILSIMTAVARQDAIALEEALSSTLARTTEFSLITRSILDWYRDVLRQKLGAQQHIPRGESDKKLIMEQATAMSVAQITEALKICWQMAEQTRFGSHSPKTFFLTGLYRLMAITEALVVEEEPTVGPPQPSGKSFETAQVEAPAAPTFTAETTADLEAELAKLTSR